MQSSVLPLVGLTVGYLNVSWGWSQDTSPGLLAPVAFSGSHHSSCPSKGLRKSSGQRTKGVLQDGPTRPHPTAGLHPVTRTAGTWGKGEEGKAKPWRVSPRS